MVPFSPEAVSDESLWDIYAWLQSLPRPPQIDSTLAAGPTATTVARNRLFPEMDATTLLARTEQLDEVALRVTGRVRSVVEGGQYTQILIQVNDGQTTVVVAAIYDTAMIPGVTGRPGDALWCRHGPGRRLRRWRRGIRPLAGDADHLRGTCPGHALTRRS
jgi:hypothetical protein